MIKFFLSIKPFLETLLFLRSRQAIKENPDTGKHDQVEEQATNIAASKNPFQFDIL